MSTQSPDHPKETSNQKQHKLEATNTSVCYITGAVSSAEDVIE